MGLGTIARNTWHKATQKSPTSPVPHLLANNDPPSGSDLKLIQETISVARAKITDIQSKHPGEALSRSSLNQVETLQEFIRIHQSLLSVLRHVPPDIWGLIFKHALPDIYAAGCHNMLLTMKFAGVCRLWRNVTISTPQLWGSLPSFCEKGAPDPSYLQHLRTILERGRGIPISFHVSEPREDVTSHPLRALLALLATQSSRWKHITMAVNTATVEELKISRKLPLLHTLNLEISNVLNPPTIITVFQDAPSLRVVKIKTLGQVDVELPWHQLEEYSEDNSAQTTGLPHVLHHSINLRRLSYFTHFRPIKSADFTHTTLSKLTSLRLHFYRDEMDCKPLLDNITLPALEDLQISNRAGILIDQVLALVRRSMCVLQRLALSTLPLQIPVGKLTELLLLTPSLQELDVYEIPDKDLERLSQPDIVPCLRSLVVHQNPAWYPMPSSINPRGFNALAKARCLPEQDLFQKEGRGCVRLEELRLVLPVPVSCHWYHVALEGWDEVPRSQDESHALSECKKELGAMLPTDYQQPRKRKFMVDPSVLQKFFRTLEDLQNVDPRVLIQSGVVYQFQELASPAFLSNRLPKAYHKYAQEKVATLVQRWCARMEQDKLMLHWIRRGQACLVYRPNQILGAQEYLFGIPEPLTPRELFWPSLEQ